MIEELKQQIDKSLKDFLLRIKKEYKLHLVHPILFESIHDFSLRKGKRIRPLLLILSYKGYSPPHSRIPQSLFNASTCMELLHNFMLIHDDIIDRSDLRRGKPTLHNILKKAIRTKNQQKLGSDLSIIAGDIVYALAIDAFLSIHEEPYRKEEALKYFIKTAAFTAMGEFIDILHGVQNVRDIKEKDVFLNYTLKTARYTFECPLVVGAILAGADKKDIAKLSQLGIMIGQAFQIQDDIIGIFGSQRMIGKSILSDLAEFKKTLLVCHAYRHLKREERKAFLEYFAKNKKSYRDLVAIRKIFIGAGSLHYSIGKIKTLINHSQKMMGQLHLHKSYQKSIWRLFLSLFNSTHQITQDHHIPIQID